MYAQVSDLIDAFGEAEVISLTDRDFKGEMDKELATKALVGATSFINSYLGRYTLPLTEVPVVLKDYCCDIARYRLCGSTTQTTEEIIERYKIARQFLVDVSKGSATLGVLPDGSQPTSNETTVIFTDSVKVFGRDNPY